MALFRSFAFGRRSDVLSYDPHKLSSPQVFVLTMVVFLAIVAFIAVILTRQISSAFASNPGLNGLIVGVLLVGILLAFVQVGRLFREVRWVNSFRAGSETTEPVLLAPMKAMLGRSASMAFSTSSMRTMLDSIGTRLDESRDTSRYLVGLLVFLGLLGTFWGLLKTIGAIGDTIQALDPGSGDAATVLGAAKKRIDTQKEFTSAMMDSIDKGVGQLVDADMNKESTRLQALQVQQQLGIQALSIANANSQNILSLFKG